MDEYGGHHGLELQGPSLSDNDQLAAITHSYFTAEDPRSVNSYNHDSKVHIGATAPAQLQPNMQPAPGTRATVPNELQHQGVGNKRRRPKRDEGELERMPRARLVWRNFGEPVAYTSSGRASLDALSVEGSQHSRNLSNATLIPQGRANRSSPPINFQPFNWIPVFDQYPSAFEAGHLSNLSGYPQSHLQDDYASLPPNSAATFSVPYCGQPPTPATLLADQSPTFYEPQQHDAGTYSLSNLDTTAIKPEGCSEKGHYQTPTPATLPANQPPTFCKPQQHDAGTYSLSNLDTTAITSEGCSKKGHCQPPTPATLPANQPPTFYKPQQHDAGTYSLSNLDTTAIKPEGCSEKGHCQPPTPATLPANQPPTFCEPQQHDAGTYSLSNLDTTAITSEGCSEKGHSQPPAPATLPADKSQTWIYTIKARMSIPRREKHRWVNAKVVSPYGTSSFDDVLIVSESTGCPFCDESVGNLVQHLADEHISYLKRAGVDLLIALTDRTNPLHLPRQIRLQGKKTPKTRFGCPACSKSTTGVRGLAAHILSHNNFFDLAYGLPGGTVQEIIDKKISLVENSATKDSFQSFKKDPLKYEFVQEALEELGTVLREERQRRDRDQEQQRRDQKNKEDDDFFNSLKLRLREEIKSP